MSRQRFVLKDSPSELENISKVLEEIAAKGGFKFKETHMSGDPLKDDQPIKVLGLSDMGYQKRSVPD